MADIRPLKVLVIGYGGDEITFIDRLIMGLVGKGVNVTIASPSKKTLKEDQPAALKWLWAPSLSANFLRRAISLIRLVIAQPQWHRPAWFRRLIAQAQGWQGKFEAYLRYRPFTLQKWDVIYFPWNSAAIDYAGLFESGMPIVISCRGSQVNIRPHQKGQEIYTAELRKTLLGADAVHCVSWDIFEEARQYGMDPNKAVVIHPAVDTGYFTPTTAKEPCDVLRLVTTSGLVWVKGYEYLIMVAAYLRDMGIPFELHIIGDGYERSRILYTALDLNLEGQVILHGKLSPEKVRQQLQLADVFVFASLSEGLPNSVLEAMSCGLCVVTSDCGGVREAVNNGVEGFVLPAREPKLMAEALRKLAVDVDLRRKMGAAARKRAQEEFRLEDQIEAFIALFDSARSSDRTGELRE